MENKRFGFVRGFEFTYQILAPKKQGKQGARKKLEIRGSVPQHLNDEMMEYLKEQGFVSLPPPPELWEKDDSNLCWMGMKKDGNVMLYAYVRSGQHFHVKENVSDAEMKVHSDALSNAVAN